MSKYIPGNQKHLCLEDRIYIENKLNEGASFKDIAKYLCKDPTTISKWCTNSSQPTLEVLLRIAEVLEVDYTELIKR